jgi:hypothetical protein
MLNRSDITAITCYGLLFGAVVLWAALWSANPNSSPNSSWNFAASREAARPPVGSAAVDLAGEQPEVRHLAKHMRIP